MKEAEEELKRRKEREERKAERERSKSIIATPGRFEKTPGGAAKKTPKRFGI